MILAGTPYIESRLKKGVCSAYYIHANPNHEPGHDGQDDISKQNLPDQFVPLLKERNGKIERAEQS